MVEALPLLINIDNSSTPIVFSAVYDHAVQKYYSVQDLALSFKNLFKFLDSL
jgi:hypothetical protein